jgi:hypothetical protein
LRWISTSIGAGYSLVWLRHNVNSKLSQGWQPRTRIKIKEQSAPCAARKSGRSSDQGANFSSPDDEQDDADED